jgi:hypothetical protein
MPREARARAASPAARHESDALDVVRLIFDGFGVILDA